MGIGYSLAQGIPINAVPNTGGKHKDAFVFN